MTELEIHKCLLSYGFYPMTLVLDQLESIEDYETCDKILKAMISYREKYKLVEEDIPTKWSKEFEKQYLSYYKNVDSDGQLLIIGNLEYYLNDIKKILDIKI